MATRFSFLKPFSPACVSLHRALCSLPAFVFAFAIIGWGTVCTTALAGTFTLPASLISEGLSESVATAFEPRSSTKSARLALEDFELSWEGAPIPDVEFGLVPKSFEWVRTGEIVVFPRARFWVKTKSAERALLENAKLSQPFLSDDEGTLRAELPVLLFSGPKNAIRVTVFRDAKETSGTLVLKYVPRDPARAHPLFIDASCSNERLNLEWKDASSRAGWAYVGCRLMHAKTGGARTSTLETYLLWDGPGAKIRLSGNPVEEVRPGLWLLKLRPHSDSARLPLTLASDSGVILLTHSAPERIRYGSLGLGLGPYRYTLQTPTTQVNTTTAVATLYASYTLTDTSRLTAFNATAVHRSFFTDTGFYFNSESIRTLDRRFSLNVMLGANAVGFRTNGITHFKLGAPQGFEATYRDAFGVRWNLSAGAFIYPKINNKSYYNLWLRYGSAGKFLELNYIAIHDEIGQQPVYTRSIGLSFGMPIVRFL